MIKKPSPAIIDAWVALNRAQQAALLKIERAFRDAGLPPLSWYDVLWELEKTDKEGLRPIEIERRVLITQSNISRLIDKLETRGYVERQACPDDGRGQYIMITTAGRDIRKRMWPVYAGAISDAVGQHLSEKDATDLSVLLSHLKNGP